MSDFAHYSNDEELLRYISNLNVTLEQYQAIDQAIHVDAREQFVGRKLWPVQVVGGGIGVQSEKYYTMTEASEGEIEYNFSQLEDQTKLTEATMNIPIIQKKFRIFSRDIASSNRTGTPLNLQVIDSYIFRLLEKEDDLLMQGWSKDGSTYEINGLYQGAGNTVGGADFGTEANVRTTVNSAIAAMHTDNMYGPYNLTLHPDQYVQLFNNQASTGITLAEWVLKRLNPGGGMTGQILESKSLTAATGLFTVAGAHPWFKYKVYADRVHREWVEDDTEDLVGRIYWAAAPFIYDSNAICTLTGI